ncbi:glycosyltransferase family 4 protein [Sideroxydans sp. CL21]|uniref:glycosyltransferase family 4 protein n=1 Tax=Sideroxydans sp. CL21 TaxID=2600596 RepID=UPI0024BCF306|nr:glycosyltransferase family 4 protein [Sideroxydans sp. CL21]
MLINTIYATHLYKSGVCYACQSILESMQSADTDVRLFCVSANKDVRLSSFHRLSLPLWAKPLGYKLISDDLWEKYTEWRYRHSFKGQQIAYLWPGTSIDTYRFAKSKGHILLTENINTHQATSKKILDAEYSRLGLKPAHGIDEERICDENAKLELVDYVFSPSEEVSKSLLNANIPHEKIIRTSYGLDSTHIMLPEQIEMRAKKKELTAIFVGRIGIRKGVHLLLEYWVKSGIKGKLKLVGNIEHSAKPLVEPYLSRHDIEHIPFTKDLESLYLDADIFIFPSLEEGSPLVTYLALGAGLPSIVSPMGGGGIVNDGCEGLIIDSHDTDGWIDAIRKLFSDAELRMQFSRNASNRAREYLWSNVGRQRRELLLAALDSRVGGDQL